VSWHDVRFSARKYPRFRAIKYARFRARECRGELVSRLELDGELVRRARELAARAAAPVVELAQTHTTVSVERATLRLAGLTGTDPVLGDGEVPWVNRVVDAVREQVGLEHGVALPVWHALRGGGDLQSLAEQVGAGTARFSLPTDPEPARAAARPASPGSTPTARDATSWWPPTATRPADPGST